MRQKKKKKLQECKKRQRRRDCQQDQNCILKVFKDQYVAVGMMQNKDRREGIWIEVSQSQVWEKVRMVLEVGMKSREDTVRSRLSSRSQLQLWSLFHSPRGQSCISSDPVLLLAFFFLNFPLKQPQTFCPAACEALGGGGGGGARLTHEDTLPLNTPSDPAIISSCSGLDE